MVLAYKAVAPNAVLFEPVVLLNSELPVTDAQTSDDVRKAILDRWGNAEEMKKWLTSRCCAW